MSPSSNRAELAEATNSLVPDHITAANAVSDYPEMIRNSPRSAGAEWRGYSSTCIQDGYKECPK